MKRKVREAKSTLTSKTEQMEKKSKGWVTAVSKGMGEAGEAPPLNFDDCERYYNDYPEVFAAVNQISSMVAGAGYHYDGGKDEMRKNSEVFSEQIGLGRKMIIMAREMLLYGNSFWERLSDGNIKWLPPKTFQRKGAIERDEKGVLKAYHQYVGREKVGDFKPEQIIHVKWNVVGNAAYGTSIVSSVRSLLDSKSSIRNDMKNVVKRYMSPRTVYIMNGADITTYKMFTESLKNLEPGQDLSILTKGNTKADAKMLSFDPRARFGEFTQQLNDDIVVGLLDPMLILGRSGARISDASATTILEAFDRIVKTIQTQLASIVENQIIYPAVQGGVNVGEVAEQTQGELKDEDYPHLVFGALSKPSYDLRNLSLLIQSTLRAGPDPTTGHFVLAPNQIEFLIKQTGLELPAAEWPETPQQPSLLQKAKQKITGTPQQAANPVSKGEEKT